jgi:hypothetical protein
MTNPPADGWEGARFLDELQGILKFPLDRKVDIPLDIDVRRASLLARRRILFFGSRLSRHCITAITLLIVEENDACLWIRRDSVFRAGLRTNGFIAVLADVHAPHEIELPVHQFRAIRPDREVLDTIGCIDWIVFLFAGHFTGLTSPAGELFDNQCMLIHGWPPSFFSG